MLKIYQDLEYPFQLPSLPYSYDALEPYIDAQTMEIHHTKHHQAYVDKLNAAVEGHSDLHDLSLAELLTRIESLPEEIRAAVTNHGGGHANHMLFWQTMSLGGGEQPAGEIADLINQTFGGFEKMKAAFAETAAAVFGSGWAWLALDENGRNLHIGHTPNQNSPLLEKHTPLLGLDVWEHAYYLKYQNRRPEYIEGWWNVVDWNKVNELLLETAR